MIVRRKFVVPDLPEPWIARPGLARAIASGLGPRCHVTLVLAGAGMGKTAALSEYVRQPPVAGEEPLVAWYGLGPADADPGVFFPHLVAALGVAVPELSEQAARIFATVGNPGLPQAASVLCDDLEAALAGRAVVLVVDDCQHLSGGPLGEALESLVAYFPETSQLVLAGRSLPADLKLTRFEVRGQVHVIREDTLRFGPDEILGVGGEEEALQARTHGWPVAVGQALRGAIGGNLSSEERLRAYLAEEVLGVLGREASGDLTALAWSDDLSAGACESLLGPDRLGALLELPALAGFLARRGEHIELQPILREAIGDRAMQTWPRADVEVLCRRLADASGDPVHAISLLLRAGAWDDAERRLVDSFSGLAAAGRLESIRSLVAQFGTKRMGTPALLFVLGELERREGRFREALVLLSNALGACSLDARELRGQICAALASAHGARGEVDSQRDFAEQALALLRRKDPHPAAIATCRSVLGMAHAYRFELDAARREFERALRGFVEAGDVAGQVKVQHNLGFAHSRVGDFARAIGHYREAVRLAEAGGRLPLAVTYSNLALAEVYLDRLSEAQGHLEQGVALAERLEADRDKAVMLRVLGRLQLRRGVPRDAEAAFDQALAVASAVGDRNTQIYAGLGRAEVAMERGDVTAAAIQAEQVAAAASDPGDPAAVDCALLRARIASRQGSLEDLERRLEALDRDLAAAPSHYLEFLIAGLKADLATARDDAAEARRWSGRVAALCSEFGYPRPADPAAGTVDGRREVAATGAKPEGPAALDVAALGDYEVLVAGERTRPGDWSITKTRITLCYLLLHPGGATKEALLELLYPDEDPARTAVNMVLSRLRHALEPANPPGTPSRFVLFQAGRYRLNQGLVTRFDVSVFREKLREAQQAGLAPADHDGRLAAAVRVYRGAFLDGIEGSPWVEIERENLRRALAGAFSERFSLAAHRDDWATLEQASGELLERDPYSQEGHRAAILALALQDRTDDAARAATTARDFLANGPHAVLEPATSDLFDQVLEDRLTIRSARELLAGS